MAITMSNAQVDDGQRQSLLGSSVTDVSVGDTSGFAGIKPDFVNTLTNSISEYITKARAELDKLESVDSNEAFQGTQFQSALTNFVTGVKEVGESYLNALEAAEQQIINSVHTVYESQDQDLGGQLSADAQAVQGQALTGFSSDAGGSNSLAGGRQTQ